MKPYAIPGFSHFPADVAGTGLPRGLSALHTGGPVSEGDFSVRVSGLQTNYSFSRFLALSALAQMNTANRQTVNANIRLRWNYRPNSDLYVIYGRLPALFLPIRPSSTEPFGHQIHLLLETLSSYYLTDTFH